MQELLAAEQADRKAQLDAGRVDTVFRVGGRGVLLRTEEPLDAAKIGKLRPRWDGPFTVIACPSPNAYTLELPRRMRQSPTVKRRTPKSCQNPSLSVPGPRRPRGPSPTRDRRASTRWSCCSIAAGCAEPRAIWCAGRITRPTTTRGCARR